MKPPKRVIPVPGHSARPRGATTANPVRDAQPGPARYHRQPSTDAKHERGVAPLPRSQGRRTASRGVAAAYRSLRAYAEFTPADFTAAVRVNFGTLYSSSWLDQGVRSLSDSRW
jgi:hypothetical protein